MNKLNLVLFGPPGAGKGTQSDKIIEKYNMTHISTGNLFREHIGNGTDLGKTAQQFMDHGNLVPDEVVIDMVEDRLNHEDDTSGYIFDGFPRTVNQAKALDNLLGRYDSEIKLTISLEVDETELKNRLLARGKVSGRPDDQNEEKINTRIEVYKNETLPVANYYQSETKLHKIKGVGSVESIFQDICDTIDVS